MANNFRITGVTSPIYTSKDGDDASVTPTDPNTPKATWSSSYGTNNILGSGVYTNAISLTSSSTRSYYADGLVVLNGSSDLIFTGNHFGTIGDLLLGSYFILKMNGFQIVMTQGTQEFNRCVIESALINKNPGAINFNSCVLESCTTTNYSNVTTPFKGCLIFNSTLQLNFPIGSLLLDSYVDSTSRIISTIYFNTPTTQFTNNNYQGKFNIAGVDYELKKDRNGVDIPSRIGNGVLDLVDIDATVYDRGNFSQDPEFLNIEKRDYFSVASSSPMIFGASGGGNIGNVSFARVIKVTDAEFTGGNLTDVVYSVNDLILDFPAVIGNGESTAIQLAPTAQVLKYSRVSALFNFNSDITAGDPENYNVPANENYATGTAGANPRRLTYKLRWTSSDDLPIDDTEWTNQGYTLAGEFVEFEHFTKPLIDITGLGNGDPNFNPVGAVGVLAKYVQDDQSLQNGLG